MKDKKMTHAEGVGHQTGLLIARNPKVVSLIDKGLSLDELDRLAMAGDVDAQDLWLELDRQARRCQAMIGRKGCRGIKDHGGNHWYHVEWSDDDK